MAVALAVLKLAAVRSAIGRRRGALAIGLAALPLAAVHGAIGECLGALAVTLALTVFFASVFHVVTAC